MLPKPLAAGVQNLKYIPNKVFFSYVILRTVSVSNIFKELFPYFERSQKWSDINNLRISFMF